MVSPDLSRLVRRRGRSAQKMHWNDCGKDLARRRIHVCRGLPIGVDCMHTSRFGFWKFERSGATAYQKSQTRGIWLKFCSEKNCARREDLRQNERKKTGPDVFRESKPKYLWRPPSMLAEQSLKIEDWRQGRLIVFLLWILFGVCEDGIWISITKKYM